MRVLYILLLVFCTVYYTNSRPLQKDELESGINDSESEDDIEITADAFNNGKSNNFLKQGTDDQEDIDQSQGLFSENAYQESNAGDDSSFDTDDNLVSDYKAFGKSDSNPEKYSDPLNYNEKMGLRSSHRQSDRYTENNNVNHQLEPDEQIMNRNVNIYNGNQRNQQNKRTIQGLVDENTKNNQMNKYDNKHTDNSNDFERSHIFRHYAREMTRVDSDTEGNMLNRDTRNVEEKKRLSEESSSNKDERLLKSDTVNEELAIKEHIKKLSDNELEELLNSLSEDKRVLLKEIIDDDNLNNAVRENINKRDITKKAEAVEDNNLIESVQSDTNKLQSNNLSADSSTEFSQSHNTDTTMVTTKQTENLEKVDETTTKSSEINSDSQNKSDLINHSDEISEVMLDNHFETDTSNVRTENNVEAEKSIKNEAKRETDLNNLDNNDDVALDYVKLSNNDYYNNKNEQDISLGEEYDICPQYINVAQISEDEIQSRNEKREVKEKENEIFDSIKALEESFPNTKTVGVTSSNSGPLIRVKRTDLSKHIMTKRLAEIKPKTKINYCPHRTENTDKNYEEGGEYDNGIFYDHTSNFKSDDKLNNVQLKNNLKSNQAIGANRNLSNSLNIISVNDDNENETTGLGSDNNSVLSGAERGDEKPMFNSKFRN